MLSDAVLSKCGTYRYLLTRKWEDGAASVTWLMLNPSTADASVDDPTIRRCIGFAKEWKFGGIHVVNLFPLRSTDPKALFDHIERPDVTLFNRAFILQSALNTRTVICGWGAHKTGARSSKIVKMIRDVGLDLHCIGHTADGSPVHPLYQPKTALVVPL